MSKPRISPLVAAIAAALHAKVRSHSGSDYVDLARAALDRVCDYLVHASPLDPQLVTALDRRDDVWFGHRCEHCGQDPSDAEGDHDQEREGSAEDARLHGSEDLIAIRTLRGLAWGRYTSAIAAGNSPARALQLARGLDLVEAKSAGVDPVAIDHKSAAAGERVDG